MSEVTAGDGAEAEDVAWLSLSWYRKAKALSHVVCACLSVCARVCVCVSQVENLN